MLRSRQGFVVRIATAAFLLFTAIHLQSCGGGGGETGGGQPTGTVTSVTVSPSNANVQPGATQQFNATVDGTGSFDSSVTWYLVGAQGEYGSLGSIDSSGLYTAPINQPNPNTLTVVAKSNANLTLSGSADVIVGSAAFHITGITISPASATVDTDATQQFTATVQGTGQFNAGVNWFVNYIPGGNNIVGTIDSTGLYTAPESIPPGATGVPITAISVVDNTISATAQVIYAQGPPVITQITPDTANASDSIQIIGQNFAPPATVFFPGANGVQIEALPNIYTSSVTLLNVVVPLSTASGEVYIVSQPPGGAAQTSNSVAFTRLPRVRIRAVEKDLSSGESTAVRHRILASDTGQPLQWSADKGTVTSDGVYTAPGTLNSDTFAIVTGCIQGTEICDQERLGLHPFRIAPTVPLVGLGASTQLQAIQGGGVVSPSWQLNGPGTLSPNGLYTASSQLTDAGGIPILAMLNNVTEQAPVGVTPAFPGIVNRVYDYFELNQTPFPLGTWGVDVGVAGNKAYVLATDQADFILDQNYYWVDVYDLSDPTHPMWVDAFEPASRGHFLSCDNYLYEISPVDYSLGPPYAPINAVFDISGPHPVLLSRQISPINAPYDISRDGCLYTEVSFANWPFRQGNPVIVDELNLANGGFLHSQYALPVQDSVTGDVVNGAASDGKRMYLQIGENLIVYDLTQQPPVQIGSLDTGYTLSSGESLVGNLLFEYNDNFFEPASQIFDITNPQPAALPSLPVGIIQDMNGATVLAGTNQNGLRTVDISNPQQPTLRGTVFDFVNAEYESLLFGQYAFMSEGYGGWAIYDVGETGGLLPEAYLPNPFTGIAALPLAEVANSSSYLFVAAGSSVGGGVYDINFGVQPPLLGGYLQVGDSASQAVALSGDYLYDGTADSLVVLDVSNPNSIGQINSLNFGVSALAVSGTSLFAGTVDKGLVVFDISNPASPVQEASVTLPASPVHMAISENLLLIADQGSGLLIYNIANPAMPVLLSKTSPSSPVFDIAVDENLALLAAGDGGLVVVDFTNPAQPQVVGQATLGSIDPYDPIYPMSAAFTVAVANRIAYIGVFDDNPNDNGNGMIYGFDYSLPDHPRLVNLGANGILDDPVLVLRAFGDYLFAGITSDFTEFSMAQPRNAINLFFLPRAMGIPENSYLEAKTYPPIMQFRPRGLAPSVHDGVHLQLPPAAKYLGK